jgi:hypothetical protein
MNIVVIDSSTVDNGFLVGQRALHPNAVLANSVVKMVSHILDRLGPSGTIDRLLIIGHGLGHGGEQGMGCGDNSDNRGTAAHALFVNNGHLRHEASLRLLTGRFAPTAVVELHGCQVARGHAGRELLRRLSDLWQVPVRAGVENQHVDAADRIEGPIVEAYHRPGHSARVRVAH